MIALYRRERAHYVQEGHTQRVVVDGTVAYLQGLIDHDDRKPLSRWFASQQKYAKLEADHLLSTPRASLRRADKIRLMAWPAPILVFLYTLIAKGCILDGWPGWLYVLQRTLAETMIAIELVDRRLRASSIESAQDAALNQRLAEIVDETAGTCPERHSPPGHISSSRSKHSAHFSRRRFQDRIQRVGQILWQ